MAEKDLGVGEQEGAGRNLKGCGNGGVDFLGGQSGGDGPGKGWAELRKGVGKKGRGLQRGGAY